MNTTTVESPNEAENQFNWPLCYEAENFLLERIDAFLKENSFARILSERMRNETGTLFLDWVDHLVLPASDEGRLRENGFVDDPLGENGENLKALWHPEAMLPRVLLGQTNRRNILRRSRSGRSLWRNLLRSTESRMQLRVSRFRVFESCSPYKENGC